jgi:hypothetical protein
VDTQEGDGGNKLARFLWGTLVQTEKEQTNPHRQFRFWRRFSPLQPPQARKRRTAAAAIGSVDILTAYATVCFAMDTSGSASSLTLIFGDGAAAGEPATTIAVDGPISTATLPTIGGG